jgi:hypothetical protein
MPSQPSAQACLDTMPPGSSNVALNTNPRAGLPDEARQCALAVLERRAAEITSVELEEIEGA